MSVERGWPRWAREKEEEMERLFERPFRWGPPWAGWRRRALAEREWVPNVDMYDREKEVVVEVELPGVDRDSIDVSVQDSILSIRAERKAPKDIPDEAYYCCERPRGTFFRTVQLPAEVDPQKVEATYADGILRLVLGKKPEILPKKIEIKVK